MSLINYSNRYPYLPIEICLFFSELDKSKSKTSAKSISSFCTHINNKYPETGFPPPKIVANICTLLCEYNHLSMINEGGPEGINNSYYCVLRDDIRNNEIMQNVLNRRLSLAIYGFKYIYNCYSPDVLPVVYTNQDGDSSIGTCFKYKDGIVTAKHCIEGASAIAIKGISSEQLRSASFEIDNRELMDLLFIRFSSAIRSEIAFSGEAELLDEVMAMGYPKVPGFHNFLTAETAKVSGRLTTSIGQISSTAKDIWIQQNLFLITARIKGGNSGGPIINKLGEIVGISVNLAEGEGDYDSMGYGTVIPISFIDKIVANDNPCQLNISGIKFSDFTV